LKRMIGKTVTSFMFLVFTFAGSAVSQNRNQPSKPRMPRNANQPLPSVKNFNLSDLQRQMSNSRAQNVNSENNTSNVPSPTPSVEQPTPVISHPPVPAQEKSYELLSLLVNGILALTTIILTSLNYRMSKQKNTLENKNSALEDKLQKTREYIQKLNVIDYSFQDIILLGPRNSGKTSVAELWSKPATNIDALPPTTKWQVHERDILEFDNYEEKHPTLDIDIKYGSDEVKTVTGDTAAAVLTVQDTSRRAGG